MKLLNLNNYEFPDSIKNIQNPPQNLWVEGNIKLLKQTSIAIIGARKCSEYGKRWCEKITKELLEYDLTIVSGLAIGIDKIAHETALKYGGKTIAVLPSGLKNIYPKENVEIYKKIIEKGGCVISEYSPCTNACKENFLERNRLVSGLSIGTLVVEAAFRSGTSVTAKLTKKQGKNVFCIPGSLDNSKSMGTNILIQKGAKLVTNAKDIVEYYPFLRKIKNIKDDYEVDKEYLDIFKVIKDNECSIDEIAKKLNNNVNDVMAKITMMEIEGIIERRENGKCILNNK